MDSAEFVAGRNSPDPNPSLLDDSRRPYLWLLLASCNTSTLKSQELVGPALFYLLGISSVSTFRVPTATGLVYSRNRKPRFHQRLLFSLDDHGLAEVVVHDSNQLQTFPQNVIDW